MWNVGLQGADRMFPVSRGQADVACVRAGGLNVTGWRQRGQRGAGSVGGREGSQEFGDPSLSSDPTSVLCCLEHWRH